MCTYLHAGVISQDSPEPLGHVSVWIQVNEDLWWETTPMIVEAKNPTICLLKLENQESWCVTYSDQRSENQELWRPRTRKDELDFALPLWENWVLLSEHGNRFNKKKQSKITLRKLPWIGEYFIDYSRSCSLDLTHFISVLFQSYTKNQILVLVFCILLVSEKMSKDAWGTFWITMSPQPI